MPLSRRDFVRAGTAAAFLNAVHGKRLPAQPRMTQDAIELDAMATLADDDKMRALAKRAVDAAKSAGAAYADVRLTRIVEQRFMHEDERVVRAEVVDTESFGFGVRALVNGYWGFAASPYWEPDEAVALARTAVDQARVHAFGTSRSVEWTPIPVAKGSWISPGIDPFTVSVEEKIDFMNSWRTAVLETYIPGYAFRTNTATMSFTRTEWVLATSEGTLVSQILYSSGGSFPIALGRSDWATGRGKSGRTTSVDGLFPQRAGWDVMLDAKIQDQIPILAEELIELVNTDFKPVDVGRYDVVFDAAVVASILGRTIGIATQLDRAIGLEANAGGTSYLGPDPHEFLGRAPIASPEISVVANRSMAKGIATVKWDDEGVLPDEFHVVRNGQLVDYQTTREQAAWIKPWYEKQQRPVQSHGCSSAESALAIPQQQAPNFVLQPGIPDNSFKSLVSGVKRGYAFIFGGASTDFQARTGMVGGVVREIVDGKLRDMVNHAGAMFNSIELWKNVTALGGAGSSKIAPSGDAKGQPQQFGSFSVSAVPMTVKNVNIIDTSRRA